MLVLLLVIEGEPITIMIKSTSTIRTYASSSIGRVAVSKTVGWGFESLLAWS